MLKISKKELQEIYLNNSNEEACIKLGVTIPTMLKYIKMAKISPKGSGNRKYYKARGKITLID